MDVLWLLLRALCLTATRSLRSGARASPALRSEDSASRRTDPKRLVTVPASDIQPTIKRHSGNIEMTTKRHRKRIEGATKAHPTSTPMADHAGQLVTMKDICD